MVMVLNRLHDFFVEMSHVERRIEPFFPRPEAWRSPPNSASRGIARALICAGYDP